MVWNDDTFGASEILYRISSDSVSTFPPELTNLSTNTGFSGGPAIAVFGNNVHVAWTDNTLGNSETLYRRSTDGGTSFTEPIKNLSSIVDFHLGRQWLYQVIMYLSCME